MMLTKRNLPVFLLLLAIVCVYGNSFGNGFHFDDFHTVLDNPSIRSLANLPRIFTDTTAFSVLPANQTYRPLVTASLALDYALARGYNVFWFHLSTLLWFLLLVVVLQQLAQQIFDRVADSPRNRWLALGVAAWFGLHPAMAETANYVIQRGDLYCTLGCVTALWLYGAYPQWRRLGLYLLPFISAMLSKPPAAVFPVLLLLYVYFFDCPDPRPSQRWRSSAVAVLPAIVADVALLGLQSAMTPKSYAPSILSATSYRLVQPYVWLRYVGALFLPLHLNVDTDLQPFSSWNLQIAAGFAFSFGMLALALYAARRRETYPIAFGLLWFVITQLPTSLYKLSEVENDHRMFFSFPGLMIAVVWAMWLAYQWLTRTQIPSLRVASARTAASLALLSLFGYAYGAHRRNQVWRDEATLWADDVAKSPHNGRGLMNYGLTRLNVGDLTGAESLFERALVYTPNYSTLEVNLGIVDGLLADRGQPFQTAMAEQHFRRAVALAPKDDTAHAYYGRWLLAQGRLTEATSQLETALALNGQRPMQRDLLLTAYWKMGKRTEAQALARATLAATPNDEVAARVLRGDAPVTTPPAAMELINASLKAYQKKSFQQAILDAQAALEIDPTSAEAWNNLGAGYGALQQWDLGIAAEQRALQLNPALAIAANNLRWFIASRSPTGSRSKDPSANLPKVTELINLSLTLNRSGRYVESLRAAREAVALNPDSPEAWNNIAANQEALHHWDEAIRAAERAVSLRPDFQLAKNNLLWSEQQKALMNHP